MNNAEVIEEHRNLSAHQKDASRIARKIARLERQLRETRVEQREKLWRLEQLEKVTEVRDGVAFKNTLGDVGDPTTWSNGSLEPVGDDEHRYARVYLNQHTKKSWNVMLYDRRVERRKLHNAKVLYGGSVRGLGQTWDYPTAVAHAEAWVTAAIIPD